MGAPIKSSTWFSGELRESLREYGRIESRVLEGFVVDPKELFADMD